MATDSNITSLAINIARKTPHAVALQQDGNSLSYGNLVHEIENFAISLLSHDLGQGDRIAVYTHKCFDAVVAMFGAALAGCIFVPINPLLKPRQLAHILSDCSPGCLVTTEVLVGTAHEVVENCADLRHVIIIGTNSFASTSIDTRFVSWADFTNSPVTPIRISVPASCPAAILYTSGSTGYPKGVLLSHSNLIAGASSVASYLDNRSEDRILALLPFSFDVGLSQLTTAFCVGATTVLHNYLLPQDVIHRINDGEISGITGVPSLWIQLMAMDWPEGFGKSLRYFANTGGAIPPVTLRKLRKTFSSALPYLMYGFTEAFRSTYLHPSEIDKHPKSIGKAIPNVEVRIVDAGGRRVGPNEPGELVHRGPLVALGYWNNPAATAEKFRPAEAFFSDAHQGELVARSGDTVKQDTDGFIYFVSRSDAMIKTSGYRVSPHEIEQAVADTRLSESCVVFGVPHEALGQGIVVVATPRKTGSRPTDILRKELRKTLPGYMLPQLIVWLETMPMNENGKPDRPHLTAEYFRHFQSENAK